MTIYIMGSGRIEHEIVWVVFVVKPLDNRYKKKCENYMIDYFT